MTGVTVAAHEPDLDQRRTMAWYPPLPKNASGGEADPRSLRVLIVDDEQEAANLLCVAVASWGHTAHGVYNGASGLEAAVDDVPNVALLDIAMPDMNGYELARELRIRPKLRSCFLIAMRASNDDHCGLGAEADLDLFLSKPINLIVLKSLLMIEGERLDWLG